MNDSLTKTEWNEVNKNEENLVKVGGGEWKQFQ